MSTFQQVCVALTLPSMLHEIAAMGRCSTWKRTRKNPMTALISLLTLTLSLTTVKSGTVAAASVPSPLLRFGGFRDQWRPLSIMCEMQQRQQQKSWPDNSRSRSNLSSTPGQRRQEVRVASSSSSTSLRRSGAGNKRGRGKGQLASLAPAMLGPPRPDLNRSRSSRTQQGRFQMFRKGSPPSQQEALIPEKRQMRADKETNVDEEDATSLRVEDIRASLGPVGKTIAASVEVGIVTAGSYISGGLFGYAIGGTFALPSLFTTSSSSPSDPTLSSPGGTPGPGGFGQRLKNVNQKALAQGKSWATLSASFSGFHALSRVIRGGKEDRWNSVFGAAATGAFLNRSRGPSAMAQSGLTYGCATYALDFVFGGGFGARGNSRNGYPDSSSQGGEFGFTDTVIENGDDVN